MKETINVKKFREAFCSAGEPTRFCILCKMWKVPGMCVSDLSKEIGESVAVVSHHLRALAKVGLLTPVRDGKKVCYRYVDKGIAKEMKDLICRKL